MTTSTGQIWPVEIWPLRCLIMLSSEGERPSMFPVVGMSSF
jgi:hypothetical protein